MSRIYLPGSASRARVKAAREAKKHRQDILTALSHGKVSRRDLLKMGLFTTAGLMAPIRGLNPFIGSVSADTLSSIPTGLAPSPLFGVQAFSQPMPRFDVLDRYAMSALPTSC